MADPLANGTLNGDRYTQYKNINVYGKLRADQIISPLSAPVAVSGDTTITAQSGFYDVDASGGDVTITLPTFDSEQQYIVRRMNLSGGNVIVDAGASTVNGSATQTISAQYTVLTIVACTTEWGII